MPGKQSLIGKSSTTSSSSGPSKFATFVTDLCKVFVSTDIPLFKKNSPEVRNFLLKYTQTDPPDETTFRKHYLPKCYKETLNKIRVLCRKENICVSIDETTDASGKKVANVIGDLKNHQTLSEKSLLLSCKEMSAVTHTTIACVFNEAMQTLWPDDVKFDNMLLLVTDATPNMKKATELLVSYPKLIHVTSVAHALHRAVKQFVCFIQM
jgi:hypothetical protein